MSAFFRRDKTKTSPDKDGHELTELWSDWNAAVQQDRPKREAEILAEIRRQAEKRGLPGIFMMRPVNMWKLFHPAIGNFGTH